MQDLAGTASSFTRSAAPCESLAWVYVGCLMIAMVIVVGVRDASRAGAEQATEPARQ